MSAGSAAGATPEYPARRSILLSSFACSPLWGSEPGVGWQWLRRLARDHHVTLLTHAYFRNHLEPAMASEGLSVQVRYVQAPGFGVHAHRQLNSRSYYTWWQYWARREAKQLLATQRFDLIHHLTWGTLRFPCFLGGLGVPLVMGPLGGGECAPLRLFAGLPWSERAFETARLAALKVASIDPIATWGPRRACLVLCKSAESVSALPQAVRGRALVMPEIGSPPLEPTRRSSPVSTAARRWRFLFAGRLLGVKGVSIALGAIETLVRQGHDVHLSIAGDGPLRAHLQDEANRRGIQDRIEFLGWIPRDQMLDTYRDADLFVFPSLHDSSGNVVLEALSRGLPVVCLDLGGPQLYVDESCGIVVSTRGRSRSEVEAALAGAIAGVLAEPGRLQAMSRSAVVHASRQSWDAVVARAYRVIAQHVGWAA